MLSLPAAYADFKRAMVSPLASMQPLPRGGDRAPWVDVAKGISITLVALWHVVNDLSTFNEILIYLRMPLFFFVSGMFLRSTFLAGNEERFMSRATNFLWIFVLWTLILAATTHIPRALIHDTSVGWELFRVARMFVIPPHTMWFMYALLLCLVATMLTRRVAIGLVAAGALLGYMVSVSDGQWYRVNFPERVIRLFPFFLVGMVAFPLVNALTERYRVLLAAMLPVFIAVSALVYFSPLSRIGLVTFPLSLIGILTLLAFARSIAETRVGRFYGWIGAGVVYVFLLHRILQFVAIEGLLVAGIDLRTGDDNATVAALYAIGIVIVPLSAGLGYWLARQPWGAVLFAPPAVPPAPRWLRA